jgi:hypothetical protein
MEEVMSVVTVQVPPNLTLEQAHKVVASVVSKLGCPGCYSGHDIRFVSAVRYAVDPASLELRVLGPQPDPW